MCPFLDHGSEDRVHCSRLRLPNAPVPVSLSVQVSSCVPAAFVSFSSKLPLGDTDSTSVTAAFVSFSSAFAIG
jgi:hypothetical protein